MRSIDIGLSQLSKQLIKFNLAGHVSNTVLDSYTDESVLHKLLLSKHAFYHKSCHDSYNERSYNRWVNKNILDSKLSSSRSIRICSRDWILGEHRFAICEKQNNEINLHRAGEHTVGQLFKE